MRAEPRVRIAARALRRTMSQPEVALWLRLRAAEPRFRRQHPLSPYVLDVYCPAARLVVEVDGWSHMRMAVRRGTLDATPGCGPAG